MLIDSFAPERVAGHSSVRDRLLHDLTNSGAAAIMVAEVIEEMPECLAVAGAYLDAQSGQWCYEFGEAFVEPGEMILGSNTWPPISSLVRAVHAMWRHVGRDQRATFFHRLADQGKHLEVLVEMIPAFRVANGVASERDVVGLGPGNRDIDWAFRPLDGRIILIDVKSRVADFLHQMRRADVNGVMPAPAHDHDVMFRSVEGKFNATDPDVQLQGCWICSYITQNAVEIQRAFDGLEHGKVHFAILGDWERDATILVRRDVDRHYLLDLFGLEASNRFVFLPG